MKNKNVCAFSTADDGYAVSSAVSLLTVRKHSPDTQLFLIGRSYSAKTKRFLKKHRIELIDVDLSDKFHTSWDYPVECYYIFAGPEILKKRGFDYSVYVDGDVYCNNDPFAVDFSNIKDFAGSFTQSKIRDILGDDAAMAAQLYGNDDTLDEPRIQTGIVYFNNTSLAKRGFLEKISAVYQQAIDNNIPRKGDDSLLALFRIAYPEWGYYDLGELYNKVSPGFRAVKPSQWLHQDVDSITDGVFFHFTNHTKPWKNTARFPTYTHEYFYHAWRRHAIDTLTPDELQQYYPEISAVLSDEQLRFYWYPTKNVGDLITPYFLQKVCGVKNLDPFTISEHEINKVERHQHSVLLRIQSLSQIAKRKSVTLARLILRRPIPVRLYVPNHKALYSVSTGSVIRLCQDHAMVYGSGVRDANQRVHPSFVRAVRGPRTRQRFLDSNYACAPIYGDPGLLLPMYYKPKTKKSVYKLGIIPHFTEYTDIKKQYRKHKDVLIIDMACGNLEKVIDQIASCKKTVSSSLHGLVLSHAYGVPTRQIEYSDRINGDGTKFLDYYEGVGLKRLEPINAAGCAYKNPDELVSFEFEAPNNIDTRKLQDAMFFDRNGFRPSARYPYA